MDKNKDMVSKEQDIDLVEELVLDKDLIESIPFESRDFENLVESYINECGYTREEAIKIASNVDNF